MTVLTSGFIVTVREVGPVQTVPGGRSGSRTNRKKVVAITVTINGVKHRFKRTVQEDRTVRASDVIVEQRDGKKPRIALRKVL